jgi:ornithine carbamoyltransferase
MRISFFGDGENNITYSLALAASLLGMHFVASSPRGYRMNRSIAAHAHRCAGESGGPIGVSRTVSETVSSYRQIVLA